MTVTTDIVWNEILHRHIFYRTGTRETLFSDLENLRVISK